MKRLISQYQYILARLQGRVLQNILQNSAWLTFDNFFRMGGNFIILVLLARYLGPAQYGAYNYALFFVLLFDPIATLGIENIAVREIAQHPDQRNQILGSAFFLKIIGGFLAFLFAISLIFFIKINDTTTFGLVLILSSIYIIQIFEIIDFYFQSQLKSKYTVYARNIAFLIGGTLKILCILYKLPLQVIAFIGLIEAVFSGVFLITAYHKVSREGILSWKCNVAWLKKLAVSGSPLMLSGIFILLNMHLDKLILGGIVGEIQAGFYFAATRISEVFYFIPMAIGLSIIPPLIEKQKINGYLYRNKLQDVFTFMTFSSFFIAIFITFTANIIINLLYGSAYPLSAHILSIHIWSGIFVFFISVCNRAFIIENLQKFVFILSGLAVLIKLILNLIFIPKFGCIGAAYISVLSWGISAIILPLLFVRTRFSIIMFFKSFLFYRYLFNPRWLKIKKI